MWPVFTDCSCGFEPDIADCIVFTADDVWCQDVVSRGELAGDGGIPQVLQDGGREDTQDLGTKTTSGGKSLCEPGSAASHDDADDALLVAPPARSQSVDSWRDPYADAIEQAEEGVHVPLGPRTLQQSVGLHR